MNFALSRSAAPAVGSNAAAARRGSSVVAFARASNNVVAIKAQRATASSFAAPARRAVAARRLAVSAVATPAAVVAAAAAVPKKNILILGGTRFIGVYLARDLIKAGHEVTLLTRGKAPITSQIADDTDASYAEYKSKVKHIAADRKENDALIAKLKAVSPSFDVVYDLNGREASEAEPILDALPGLEQYIFCSSAGVYLKTDQPPHVEGDATDPKSRHKGKCETEALLDARGVNWTSIRPVYIYGPLNYNPVEEWFFHRIAAGRPIPVPGSGLQVTQLGHVKDLADAFSLCLGNPKAFKQIYNISGERLVTFDGIARACAEAAGAPEPELVHFNAKDFDFGKKKAFPMRDQHFFTSVTKAREELGWEPKFGLVEGLRDSYVKDFGRGQFRKAADFETDDMVLAKVKGLVKA